MNESDETSLVTSLWFICKRKETVRYRGLSELTHEEGITMDSFNLYNNFTCILKYDRNLKLEKYI